MNQHRTYADLRREEMRWEIEQAQKEFDREDGPARLTPVQEVLATLIVLFLLAVTGHEIWLALSH